MRGVGSHIIRDRCRRTGDWVCDRVQCADGCWANSDVPADGAIVPIYLGWKRWADHPRRVCPAGTVPLRSERAGSGPPTPGWKPWFESWGNVVRPGWQSLRHDRDGRCIHPLLCRGDRRDPFGRVFDLWKIIE